MKIIHAPDPRLLQRCEAVTVPVDGAVLRRARRMLKLMHRERGIGLAAPQIGWSARVVTMAVDDELVLINPVVLSASEETESGIEGCLSLPNVSVLVERPVRVTVEAFIVFGRLLRASKQPMRILLKAARLELSGLSARCAQHEIDHLDGVLFTTRGRVL